MHITLRSTYVERSAFRGFVHLYLTVNHRKRPGKGAKIYWVLITYRHYPVTSHRLLHLVNIEPEMPDLKSEILQCQHAFTEKCESEMFHSSPPVF